MLVHYMIDMQRNTFCAQQHIVTKSYTNYTRKHLHELFF